MLFWIYIEKIMFKILKYLIEKRYLYLLREPLKAHPISGRTDKTGNSWIRIH
jgi:hypothetical protein